jgi:hypothetical protein
VVSGIGPDSRRTQRAARELVLELSKVEEVLATLEELLNEEGLRRVREAEEEYRKEDYIVVESGKEVEKLLE